MDNFEEPWSRNLKRPLKAQITERQSELEYNVNYSGFPRDALGSEINRLQSLGWEVLNSNEHSAVLTKNKWSAGYLLIWIPYYGPAYRHVYVDNAGTVKTFSQPVLCWSCRKQLVAGSTINFKYVGGRQIEVGQGKNKHLIAGCFECFPRPDSPPFELRD